MLRTKLVAASLATGLALSGAYALSANAAPKTPGTGTKLSTPKATATPGAPAAGIDMDSDKPSYQSGESYTITVTLSANTDGDYTVNYSKVTGATCGGAGSTTLNIAGSNGSVTTKTTSFTCKINSFPVNGTVTLTTPAGVQNLTPNNPYTIGGTLPGTPTPTTSPTKKPTPTKAPTKKPSTGGLASTGV